MKLRYRMAALGLIAAVSTAAAAPAFAATEPPLKSIDEYNKMRDAELNNENCSDVSNWILGAKSCTAADLVLGARKAPLPQSPTVNVGDYFSTLRPQNAPLGSPFDDGGPTMFASSGLGGFLVGNYDAPGADDVVGAGQAITDTSSANFIQNISISITGATAVIERYAFNPTDLTKFLADFTSTAMDTIRAKVWLPWIGIGLLAATCVALLDTGVKGRTRDALWAAAWSIIVLGVAGVFMIQATPIQQYTQTAVTQTIASLNADVNPGGVTGSIINDNGSSYGENSPGSIRAFNPIAMSDLMTDTQIRQIHFQGWCRREFGSTSTKTARDYCQKMWDAQRYTYAEQSRIDADQTGQVRKSINDGKAANWDKWAAEIKASDSAAYSCMQGLNCDRKWNALTELGFTLSASAFRILAAALILASGAVFVLYAAAFVITSPYTVVAKLGQSLALSLLAGAFKCFLFALVAGIATWLFMLWAQIAMSPSISAGWSFILMIIGTWIFWGTLRPERKIANLVTFGKVKANGKRGMRLADRMLTMLAGKGAIDTATDVIGAVRNDKSAEQEKRERAEDFRHTAAPVPVPNPWVNYMNAPLGQIGNVHEGVVIEKPVTPNIQHSPEMYEPEVIKGEVINDPYDRTYMPPETNDYDGSTELDLFDPADRKERVNQ